MRTLSSAEARAGFAKLLDAVEQGETIVLTRHGRPIARVVPAAEPDLARVAQAIANLETMREASGRLGLDEILSTRHEGHRY